MRTGSPSSEKGGEPRTGGAKEFLLCYLFIALVTTPASCVLMTVIGWMIGRNSSAAFLKFFVVQAVLGMILGLVFGSMSLLGNRSPSAVSMKMAAWMGGILLVLGLMIAASNTHSAAYTWQRAVTDALSYGAAGAISGFFGMMWWKRLNGS